ncbi:VOC family protein [Sphingobium sufflavum]|uniref:VOC family protein n=1 Tax=Sphingobium sufflavum TaxID=1129547 RepID=UPI001F2F0F3F|nr:VOC family protein [Sphingobium sufflavum]MCE7796612.1 VOC family protein [Sphingobium sufflavum]
MTIQGLDHVNIRVRDVEATAAFFIDVLGMQRSPERASWILDASGHPAIHLGAADAPYPSDAWRPFEAQRGSGAVHHVALCCTGFDRMVERLTMLGVEHRTSIFLSMSLRQILVVEPGGILLELNFKGE